MQTLRQQFGDVFSRSAFVGYQDEERIQGKYGSIVQFEDGTFDVWFVKPDLEPLSTVRINRIVDSLPRGTRVNRADGEMWVQGRGRAFVLGIARYVGIKRKRVVSPEQARAAAERLAAYRSAR